MALDFHGQALAVATQVSMGSERARILSGRVFNRWVVICLCVYNARDDSATHCLCLSRFVPAVVCGVHLCQGSRMVKRVDDAVPRREKETWMNW